MSTTEGVSAADAVMTSYPEWTTLPLSVAERYPESIRLRFIPDAVIFNRMIGLVWLGIGLIGNSLSAVVWLKRHMRRHNSSAIYVAALSINCIVFLVLDHFNFIQQQFGVSVYRSGGVCQLYLVLYFIPQYLSQLLVLAFSVDRYIAVCHPLKRQIYCRPSRALKVIAGLFAGCFLCSAFHAYSHVYDSARDRCDELPDSIADEVHLWTTEMTFNLFVPLATIVINVLVIRRIASARRARARELSCLPDEAGVTAAAQKMSTTSTTLMLLSVSFFYVVTTLPATLVYTLHPHFRRGDDLMTDEQVLADPTWKRYFAYCQAEYIIRGLSISHYACNFFIFIPTGRDFRRTLCDLLSCRCAETARDDKRRHTNLTLITDSPRRSPASNVRGNARPAHSASPSPAANRRVHLDVDRA